MGKLPLCLTSTDGTRCINYLIIALYMFALAVVTAFVGNYVAQKSSQNGTQKKYYQTAYISVS